MGAGLRVAVERSFFDLFGVAANAGFEYFATSSYHTIDQKYQVPLGVGATLPFLGGRFSANAAFLTVLLLQGFAPIGTSDWSLGVSWNIGHGWTLTGGGSVGGFQSQDSSASFRGMLGLKWAAEEPTPANDLEKCGARPLEKIYNARAMTEEELKSLDLPYLPGGGNPVPTLTIGEGTGKDADGKPWVKGAQVVFAVDLEDLPPRDAIVDLYGMTLTGEVRSLPKEESEEAADGATDSGVLCVLNLKVCSGDLTRSAKWKGNVNRKFFEGRETPNDHFARRPKSTSEAVQVSLEFSKLLENSMNPDPMALVYGDAKQRSPVKKKTLYFALGLDSHLSSGAQLVLKMREDSCWKTRSWVENAEEGK